MGEGRRRERKRKGIGVNYSSVVNMFFSKAGMIDTWVVGETIGTSGPQVPHFIFSQVAVDDVGTNTLWVARGGCETIALVSGSTYIRDFSSLFFDFHRTCH